MKVLIAFQANNKSCAQVAEAMKKVLEESHSVELQSVEPLVEMRTYDYLKHFRKKKRIPLRKAIEDVKKYDLVVIGTPVIKFSPTPLIETYVRSLKNTKGKHFVLYCTPVGFAGTTIKRLSHIISTKGGKVKATLTVSSIYELNEKKLSIVKEFTASLFRNGP